MDVLKDYESMLGGIQADTGSNFDMDFYKKIRVMHPVSAAIFLARTGKNDWLKFFMKSHREILAPFWLLILENIPEVIPVENYEFLLPDRKASLWEEKSWRKEADWVEILAKECPELLPNCLKLPENFLAQKKLPEIG